MPDPLLPPDGEAAGTRPSMSEEGMEALLQTHARIGACPPLDLLFAAEEDLLPAATSVSIREHAAHCALCRTLLVELAPTDAVFAPGVDARIRTRIQERAGDHPSAARSARKPTFWLSMAAVAAVAIVSVVGMLSYRLWRSRSGQSTVAVNHPPAQAGPPAADFPELHQLTPLTPPDDVPALVMRGAAAAHGPTIEDLVPAFRAYNRGAFAQAAAAFAPLVARFPQSDIPPLYLGVSRLQLGQNGAAQHSLAQAYGLAGSAHHDAAAWYLAVANLRLHQPQAAAAPLRELCGGHSAYAARACALVKEIGPS